MVKHRNPESTKRLGEIKKNIGQLEKKEYFNQCILIPNFKLQTSDQTNLGTFNLSEGESHHSYSVVGALPSLSVSGFEASGPSSAAPPCDCAVFALCVAMPSPTELPSV